jgi:predicted PurR-regulated permease PerM
VRRPTVHTVSDAERAERAAELRDNVRDDLDDAEPPAPRDVVEAAEARAAEISTPALPLGEPGRPLNRRSPFVIGMAGAAGVAVTALAAELIIIARDVLVLIGLALFLAIGLEPAVAWLTRRSFPRWAAVTIVVLGLLGAFGGFLGAAIPQLVTQATLFVTQVPSYLQSFQADNAWFRDLDARFHIAESLTALAGGGALELFNGILGAGAIVFDVLSSTLIVIVLFVYFLGDFPRIRRGLHRAVPNTRRPRFILISDEVFAKVGAYVLGIMVCAVIAGTSSLLWTVALGVPFPLLLAIMVMLLDVIPVIGTSVAGIICTLVAFTVSPGTGIATAIFFLVYRVVEDYVLVPRIVGRAVEVPALLTIVALLLGGVLLGVIGAVVAVPVGAAILLVAKEVVVPRLDAT